MTIKGKLISVFPCIHMSIILFAAVYFIHLPNIFSGSLLIFCIYILPLLCFRLHSILSPLKHGFSRLDTPMYSPWWGNYQIQFVFNTFPVFERILHLIPGCYSQWLRLWGSRIGKNIVWTPHVEVTDRDLLSIADNVLIGHKVAFYSHAIQQKANKLYIYTMPIEIQKNCFIGAGSAFSPGTIIREGCILPRETKSTKLKHVFAKTKASC